jgi:hypothetical protein
MWQERLPKSWTADLGNFRVCYASNGHERGRRRRSGRGSSISPALPRRISTSGLSAMSCTLTLRESRQRPAKIDKKVLVPLSVEEEEEEKVVD